MDSKNHVWQRLKERSLSLDWLFKYKAFKGRLLEFIDEKVQQKENVQLRVFDNKF